MTTPTKIKYEGKVYISESIAPNKTGEKVMYKGNKYVAEAEELPPEMVMFEGVAWKRGPSVEDYMKKVLTESVGAGKPMPKKIRLKGTNLVFEAVDFKNQETGEPENVKVDTSENEKNRTWYVEEHEGYHLGGDMNEYEREQVTGEDDVEYTLITAIRDANRIGVDTSTVYLLLFADAEVDIPEFKVYRGDNREIVWEKVE